MYSLNVLLSSLKLLSSSMSSPLGVERIIQALLDLSTEAVLTYRDISGRPDNELPEAFIQSHIAVSLHRDLALLCRCEYPYIKIALPPDAPVPEDMIRFGGLEADLALFDGEHPLVAVEIKIDADGRPPFAILADIEKLRLLVPPRPVIRLALVMMTDRVGRTYRQGRTKLDETPGVSWNWKEPPQKSRDCKWCWAMGCAHVT